MLNFRMEISSYITLKQWVRIQRKIPMEWNVLLDLSEKYLVSVVNFEHISHLVVMFLLLTLNMRFNFEQTF